jgi:hypothetical protein
VLNWLRRHRIAALEMRQLELLGRLQDLAKGPDGIQYRSLLRELNGVNEALKGTRAAASLCSHEWKGEGPPPRRWSCACGTIVYRSYEDYCDV